MSQPNGYMRVAGYHRVGGSLPGKLLSVTTYRDSVIVICEEEDGSPSTPYISWYDGSWRKIIDLEACNGAD